MCGIAGIFGLGDEALGRAMVRTLAHRGPDDEHVVAGRDFTLAARRLSIVDLAGGRQPLANERGTVFACQNGEIYNSPGLRPELEKRGHRLLTHCDTEVLPHLYEDYGDRLPEHIDGMFAVAVWDDEKKTGLLTRDRMGKKPLYYTQRDGRLYFASEIKALLQIPRFERRLNLEAMHHYLSYKHVPHPLSIFEGIRILPPAHALVYRPDRELEVRPYWALDFAPAAGVSDLTEDEAVEELLRLLRQGVERRLMADVPIGFFLSGGIDSSLSTVLAAELCPDRIRTFCLTYAEDSSNPGKDADRRWARWVAERYGTDHREEVLHYAHLPESIRQVLTHFDEPFAGVISTFFLSQLISQHVKVALSGDGADELFGSYLSHRLAFPLAEHADSPDVERIRRERPDLAERLIGKEDWEWRYALLVMDDAEKLALYRPDVRETLAQVSTRDHVRAAFDHLTAADPLNRILEAEWKGIFADQVLAFVDRLSMAHSLEVRTAYLDTDFVSFIAALPGRLKVRNGDTKYILKQAARRYFPAEMVERSKEGFLMPITQWISGDLEDYVRDTLAPSRINRHGILEPAAVGSLVDLLYRPETGADYRIVNKVYNLLVFQEWCDLYLTSVGGSVSGPAAEEPPATPPGDDLAHWSAELAV